MAMENDEPCMDEPEYDESQHDEPDSEIDKPADPYAQAIKTEVEKIYGKNLKVVFHIPDLNEAGTAPHVCEPIAVCLCLYAFSKTILR